MKKNMTVITGILGVLAGAAGAGLYIYKKMQPEKDRVIPGRRRIACIGDSITFGAGVALTRKRDAWPYLLNARLGDSWQVLNYGISGATASSAGDLPYRKNDFLETALKTRAEKYILMLGSNDSKPYNWNKEQYEQDLRAMVQDILFPDFPHSLILMLPPKAFPFRNTGAPAFDIVDETIRDEICPVIVKIAEEYDLQLIDLYRLTEDHPEYFIDGVHPNRAGNKAISDYIFGLLEIG